MIEITLIGGPANGRKFTISPGITEFEVTVGGPMSEFPAALAQSHSIASHRYKVHRLHEAGQDYPIAVWRGHDRPVIETLIDGYRPTGAAPTAAQAQAMQSALRDPRQP